MSSVLNIKVGKWDYSRWQRRFASHFNQPNVKTAIHQVYADMSEKYVPYDTGRLSASRRVNEKRIAWGGSWRGKNRTVKYARYQYYSDDSGWKRNRTVHPLARSHWDMAVFENEMNGFKWRVTHELKRIAREEGW